MKQRLSSSVAPALETLYNQFERRYDIADPIQRVRDFTDPRDQEIVGLLSSGLAFGRVRTIMRSIDAVLDVVGSSPSSFVRHFKPSDHRDTLGAINHRWIRGPDILAFVWVIRQILERSGSIQNFFLQGYDSNADDVGGAIDSFSERALGFDCGLIYASGQSRGVDYFFSRPSKGSACKRINLYLRWMVRQDSFDFGIWRTVSPSQLVIPLDTHIVRVGRCLGLTGYRTPGWSMARQITSSLRRFDPIDPVKYDFALCHLSMEAECGFNEAYGSARCPLRSWCRPGRGRWPRSRRPSVPH